jgi:hypothetical protein
MVIKNSFNRDTIMNAFVERMSSRYMGRSLVFTATTILLLVVLVTCFRGGPGSAKTDLAELVNPLMGTDYGIPIFKREYLSCHCAAMGDELLDTADREDGRWLGLYLRLRTK